MFDGLFLLCVLFFAHCALQGSLALSAGGVSIDSDLATYAQAMAGANEPSRFQEDPVLATPSPANSIVTAERALASVIAPDDPAIGLLRAGSCILVLYFVSWYVFGRWLFRSRWYALLLLTLVSITVWVGLGTFWGITHSDPVPRVFHAALWPWMLMLAIHAYKRVALRPLALFVAGLGIWFHGVSALSTGAFFFCAFFFHKPKYCSFGRHARILLLSLLLFFLPVLFFLWPSLGQSRVFTQGELSTFASAFALRWHEDYGNITESLCALVLPTNPVAYILYGGLIACLFSWYSANERLRTLARMLPAFCCAYFCVAVFSLLETHYAASLGRVPMGHELVRGVKFFVPLAWILICGVAVVGLRRLPKKLVRMGILLLLGVTIVASNDRQYQAAGYALSEATGLECLLPKDALAVKERSERAREALVALEERRTLGDTVFCLEDSMMAVRYAAKTPLCYSFKDGYVFFYNNDHAGMKTWLMYTKLVASGARGIAKALQRSQATWYLASQETTYPFEASLSLVWKNDDWKLFATQKQALPQEP